MGRLRASLGFTSALLWLAAACSAGSRTPATTADGGVVAAGGTDGSSGFSDAEGPDAAPPPCPPLPAPPTSIAVTLAPAYQGLYSVYELGPVPGVSPTAPLGGATLMAGTTDTLLIGVESENANGALYRVKITRDACNHIVGYDGVATKVAAAPYVDATLLYGPGDVLIFPQWSGAGLNRMGQLPASLSGLVELPMASVGIGGGGPGSAGFVPPTVSGAAGQLRVLTQNAATEDGYWYHVDYRAGGAGGTFLFLNGVKKATLPRWPGGFAYVPVGSPGFDEQALIVAEWNFDSVATYLVDSDGDPVPSTRTPFFSTFPRPWGAYFEPLAGDYLFLTWRAQVNGAPVPDRVVVVAGFKPPPPPPTAPPPK